MRTSAWPSGYRRTRTRTAHIHVLDTHALMWHLEGNPHLGQDAKAGMADPRGKMWALEMHDRQIVGTALYVNAPAI